MWSELEEIYRRLLAHFGPQHWWPAESPFEVMVGAILTQNTNWRNVERAIANLKGAGVLSPAGLYGLGRQELAALIRPAGYYNLKAERLGNLLRLLVEGWAGETAAFLAQPPEELRRCLLEVKGIGPETADSILLYAAGYPFFVVDAYTHRLLYRHGLIPEESGYQEIQELFHTRLRPDPVLFNEYHALIVRTGKEICRRSRPCCADCPLRGIGGVDRWNP